MGSWTTLHVIYLCKRGWVWYTVGSDETHTMRKARGDTMSNSAWVWWLTIERSLVVAGSWARASGDAAAWQAASDALDELDALRYAAYQSK